QHVDSVGGEGLGDQATEVRSASGDDDGGVGDVAPPEVQLDVVCQVRDERRVPEDVGHRVAAQVLVGQRVDVFGDLTMPLRAGCGEDLFPGGAVPQREPGAEAASNAQEQGADQHLFPSVPHARAGGSRVGDREQVQHLEQPQGADGVGDVFDHGRVVEISSSGGPRQQQMVADRVLQHLGVEAGDPDPPAELAGDVRPDPGVVTALSFADVVEQGGEGEEVRGPHFVGYRRVVRVASYE